MPSPNISGSPANFLEIRELHGDDVLHGRR